MVVKVMMRRFCFLFMLLLFFGCGDDSSNEGEILKDLVKDEVVEDKSKKITWRKDGKEMVLIPAGSFEMGDHLDGIDSSRPVHRVTLDDFYMDIHEVTVGQFREFVNQSGYSYDGWNYVSKYSPGDDYPMVYVSWETAYAYAEWAGKRLPTEAEWEYAARGGLIGRRYPWGDEITHDDANYWDNGTSFVGSYSANGYGLYDMGGNVFEWCADWYDENYYSDSPVNNPEGPKTGEDRVLRGGSWLASTHSLRVANRAYSPPFDRAYRYGFRCCVSGWP